VCLFIDSEHYRYTLKDGILEFMDNSQDPSIHKLKKSGHVRADRPLTAPQSGFVFDLTMFFRVSNISQSFVSGRLSSNVMLKKIKRHIPFILLAVAFIAYVLHEESSVYIGDYDAIMKAVHDKPSLHKIASSCGVELKNRGSSVGNNDDKLYASSTFFIIGDSDKVAQFMKAVYDSFESKIESNSARIHGRGRSGSDSDIFGFDLRYTRGSRSGFVEVRRVPIGRDQYYEKVDTDVYDFRITTYEHQ